MQDGICRGTDGDPRRLALRSREYTDPSGCEAGAAFLMGISSVQLARIKPSLPSLQICTPCPATKAPNVVLLGVCAVRSTLLLNHPLESTALSLLIVGSNKSAGLIVLSLYLPPEFLVDSHSHLAAVGAVVATGSLAAAGAWITGV